jgi:hypothetical protein
MEDLEIIPGIFRARPDMPVVDDLGERIGKVVEVFNDQGLRIRVGRSVFKSEFDVPTEQFVGYIVTRDVMMLADNADHFFHTQPLGVRFGPKTGS